MLIKLLELKLNINPRWLINGELPIHLENPEWETGYIPIIADIPAGHWKEWIDTYIAWNYGAISNIISVQAGATGALKLDIPWPTK